ncbi:unnamed protein product [Clonostachys rosea]|uniref:Succinate-semialdehyde dehydrogenase, mitochondrial n=1 Tax=Bionectria ochroleuca TaxID=29856 RepID=A0ABY6UTM5_BIOOC|nr:unnamed protein product [Clonostachys rosea]
MSAAADDFAKRYSLKLADPSLLITQGLVAGRWRSAPEDSKFPVYEPASGTVLLECANFTRNEIIEAIQSAETGQKQYFKSTTAKERGALLRIWHDLIQANKEDLAGILSLENGKTLEEAKGEVAYAASFVAWFSEEATRSYGDVIPSSYRHTTVMTFKEPVGVCGIITPWNFPAAMITRKIAPALAAGCSVVIKPPSETPFSALALAELAMRAGIPSTVIHVVPTKDRSAASELATNPIVKKLSFTGSTGVGKYLAGLASQTMKKVSMELGGNAPFIVFEDADLDLAALGAMQCKFRSTGQTCVCANRIFIHRDVVDTFAEKLKERVQQLKLGLGIATGVTQGPLVNLAAVKKIESHVEDALKLGGELVCGGKRPTGLGEGYFYEPTIVKNATPDMIVSRDETFGPLAAIFPFSDEDDVVEQANETEFGLASYFYSKDVHRCMRVARALESGMVGVNVGMMSAAETPFGGVKESGYGREGSKYGLDEYQTIKAVTLGPGQ